MKICVLGAAGAGTTTISKYISFKYGYKHFESDYFAWEQTNPPFQKTRPDVESIKMLNTELEKCENLVISGNIAKWGEQYKDKFDLVIFLYAPTNVRLERIRYRERELYGKRVLPKGEMYQNFEVFLNYAKAYDTGDKSFRSLSLHNDFLKIVSCPVIKVNTDANLQNILKKVYNKIDKLILKKQKSIE